MSLAAVLHHTNHSHDSIVLLHSAVDTSSELSIYHFVLGNIYAVSKPCVSLSSSEGETLLFWHIRFAWL